ncbi:MAG TPA: hypothetical protein VGE36_14190 [Roseateles sp.]
MKQTDILVIALAGIAVYMIVQATKTKATGAPRVNGAPAGYYDGGSGLRAMPDPAWVREQGGWGIE